jgi:NAD(P)H-dependent FMN reductase
MSMIKILAFAGSARKESWNQRLIKIAARYARDQGADVTLINLGDLNLPIMDEDLEKEKGAPEGAVRLKQLMFEHQALLIACPEYNSSITPLLKNAIDWASRKAEGELPLQAYRGKVCGLISASPGALGGLRGLVHVRAILGNIGVFVVPEQTAIGSVHQAFNDAQDDLKEETQRNMLRNTVSSIVKVANALAKADR